MRVSRLLCSITALAVIFAAGCTSEISREVGKLAREVGKRNDRNSSKKPEEVVKERADAWYGLSQVLTESNEDSATAAVLRFIEPSVTASDKARDYYEYSVKERAVRRPVLFSVDEIKISREDTGTASVRGSIVYELTDGSRKTTSRTDKWRSIEGTWYLVLSTPVPLPSRVPNLPPPTR